jgi:hypothetical protein
MRAVWHALLLSAAADATVSLRVANPAEGTRIVGSNVPVDLRIRSDVAVPEDSPMEICLKMDWGDYTCVKVLETVEQPISLENVLPGQRVLRAWLRAGGTGSARISPEVVRNFKCVSAESPDAEVLDVTTWRSVETETCKGGSCSSSSKRAEYFDAIYRDNLWAAGGEGASSGTGSTLQFTQNIVRSTQQLLDAYSITSMLDMPCGDMTWMKQVGGSRRSSWMKHAPRGERIASAAAGDRLLRCLRP